MKHPNIKSTGIRQETIKILLTYPHASPTDNRYKPAVNLFDIVKSFRIKDNRNRAKTAKEADQAEIIVQLSALIETAEQERERLVREHRDRERLRAMRERAERLEVIEQRERERRQSDRKQNKMDLTVNPNMRYHFHHVQTYIRYLRSVEQQERRERLEAERRERERINRIIKRGEAIAEQEQQERREREREKLRERFTRSALYERTKKKRDLLGDLDAMRERIAEQRETRNETPFYTWHIVTETFPDGGLTDTATAIIDRVAKQIAYTAVKINRQRAGDNPNSTTDGGYQLMSDIMAEFSKGYRAQEQQAERERLSNNEPLQVLKKRQRKKVAGIWLRCDDEYLEFTDSGKEFMRIDDSKNISINHADIVNEVWLSIMENSRYITCWNDVYNFSRFAYRRINSYIRNLRQVQDQLNRPATVTEYTGNALTDTYAENTTTRRQFDRKLGDCLTDETKIEMAAQLIVSEYKPRSKKSADNLRSVITLGRLGYTQSEISDIVGISQQAISKYEKIANSIATRCDVMQGIRDIFAVE